MLHITSLVILHNEIDFCQGHHIIGMLDEMLCAGDIEAARNYLTDYRIAMPKNEVMRYCKHTALNALLNYYAEAAHQNAVRLRIVIDLPDRVPLSDVDLCNIVGNMLEMPSPPAARFRSRKDGST